MWTRIVSLQHFNVIRALIQWVLLLAYFHLLPKWHFLSFHSMNCWWVPQHKPKLKKFHFRTFFLQRNNAIKWQVVRKPVLFPVSLFFFNDRPTFYYYTWMALDIFILLFAKFLNSKTTDKHPVCFSFCLNGKRHTNVSILFSEKKCEQIFFSWPPFSWATFFVTPYILAVPFEYRSKFGSFVYERFNNKTSWKEYEALFLWFNKEEEKERLKFGTLKEKEHPTVAINHFMWVLFDITSITMTRFVVVLLMMLLLLFFSRRHFLMWWFA